MIVSGDTRIVGGVDKLDSDLAMEETYVAADHGLPILSEDVERETKEARPCPRKVTSFSSIKKLV